jgi:hypothetical protein
MRKIVVSALAYMLAGALILTGLTGCPGRNPAPPAPTHSFTPFPSASYLGSPPQLPAVGYPRGFGKACPPGAQYKLIGFIDDPTGKSAERPLHMLVNQYNRNGDPGTVADEQGRQVPGAGYAQTGTSPLSLCIVVNPGDAVFVTVTFSIQTNLPGYRVGCISWHITNTPGGAFIVDNDDHTIEAGEQVAAATCEVQGVA